MPLNAVEGEEGDIGTDLLLPLNAVEAEEAGEAEAGVLPWSTLAGTAEAAKAGEDAKAVETGEGREAGEDVKSEEASVLP